jgi:citrate synthase
MQGQLSERKPESMKSTVKTSITRITPDQIIVRGFDLCEMMGKLSYAEVVFLLIAQRLPTPSEGRILDAILVSSIDHGVDAPSTHVARSVASCGVPVQTAISAGINAIGDSHGGAGEQCARILQETLAEHPGIDVNDLARRLVAERRAVGQRLPGFGHRMHDPDPRAVRLLTLADAECISGRHVALARALEMALLETTGRSLPLNVDGAIAAILSDMGIDWRFGKSLFIISRTAGLAAQVYEQMTTGKPLNFAQPVNAEYIGPQPRSLPGEDK